jgi:hypothetical protein
VRSETDADQDGNIADGLYRYLAGVGRRIEPFALACNLSDGRPTVAPYCRAPFTPAWGGLSGSIAATTQPFWPW